MGSWFNHHRLLEPIGDIPPAEAEQQYYRQFAAWPKNRFYFNQMASTIPGSIHVMRYTLKDYQEDALREILTNLKDAALDWHQRGRLSAFSLSAATGSGKTVIAAAVIEALFTGNPDNDFTADPGAVVLWFTDDPSLNKQTRFRITAASDQLGGMRTAIIENTFSEEKLMPGTVYFLNSQKLSKNALLVRETTPQLDDDSQQPLDHMPPPDNRARTMWEILKNTIEDARLTLYLILDEAHRGMKNDGERATTVRRLINGTHGMPPIPIVWGISATVENFHRAMTQQRGRTTLPAVAVDPVRVQESGLLKDDIRLEFPAEAGSFNLALLRRATQKLRDASAQWADYHVQQNMPGDPLAPLMVVQMANKVTDTELQEAVAAIQEIWPELKDNALANVFGEHKTIDLPNATIPYVEPQLVQGRPFIRILFAKDAVSTGWDCPRAEVFISFRTAKDETYITQMLGRMVRTPLARSIPGNHLLNSVACVLPGFSSDTAKRVAKTILGDVPVGLRVLTDPQDMGPTQPSTTPCGRPTMACQAKLYRATMPVRYPGC